MSLVSPPTHHILHILQPLSEGEWYSFFPDMSSDENIVNNIFIFSICTVLTATAFWIVAILYYTQIAVRRWVLPILIALWHRITRALRKKKGRCIFLQLPPELRLQIYSHLSLSASQTFRQTCGQINREIEHERRRDFERHMIRIQKGHGDRINFTPAYPIKPFEVNLILRIAAGSGQVSHWDESRIEHLLENLPATARFIHIALEPGPGVSDAAIKHCFDLTYEALFYHLYFMESTRKAGDMHLRSFRVVCTGNKGSSMPDWIYNPDWMLPWHKVVGINSGFDKAGYWQTTIVLDGCQWIETAFLCSVLPISLVYVCYMWPWIGWFIVPMLLLWCLCTIPLLLLFVVMFVVLILSSWMVNR